MYSIHNSEHYHSLGLGYLKNSLDFGALPPKIKMYSYFADG